LASGRDLFDLEAVPADVAERYRRRIRRHLRISFMAADERYATKWRGLLPRFVLASLVIAFAGELLQKAVSELFPFQYQNYSSLTFTLDVQIVVSFAFLPFAVFALFYLSSRVRIDLGNDYAAVAASIFLGTLVVALLFGLPEALSPGYAGAGSSVGDSIIQLTAGAVEGSIYYAFVGFAAILLSYRRRM
jgi:hypothetical protein